LSQEGILKLLDRLQGEFDLAYMFITHDLATVKAIADEVVVMKEGIVVEKGPKAEMFQPPHDPYTELLCPRCRRWTPTGCEPPGGAQGRPGRRGRGIGGQLRRGRSRIGKGRT
jgi:ABC-type dipeptide/oligopeptide/nickel transport system ATPase component